MNEYIAFFFFFLSWENSVFEYLMGPLALPKAYQPLIMAITFLQRENDS